MKATAIMEELILPDTWQQDLDDLSDWECEMVMSELIQFTGMAQESGDTEMPPDSPDGPPEEEDVTEDADFREEPDTGSEGEFLASSIELIKRIQNELDSLLRKLSGLEDNDPLSFL